MEIDVLQSLMLNDNGFAFNPVSGESFQISETGIAIIRWILSGESEPQVITRLTETYEVDRSAAERDLERFILSLKSMKLVA